MNVFKISWLLFKNNIKLYKFYIIALGITSAILYNFLAVDFNPYLQVLNEQYSFAQAASSLCSIVLVLTVLFFMFHANNFFYTLRYKEIGTYMLMGISESKIGIVFALESIILGGIAAVVGLLVGMLFSKLFFMLLGKAMILNTQIPFYIPLKAIVTLLIVFGCIILIMGIKNFWMIKRSRLIDILNASKKEQKIPKIRWVRGIAGILCICTAYYMTLHILDLSIDFIHASIGALILICIGTYFFFGSFMGIVLSRLIKNKKIVYKGSRLVSFSNTLFRIGSHYRSLSMTAILCAAVIAAFSGSLALKYFADNNVAIEAPYSISYTNQDEATAEKIKALIRESQNSITAEHKIHYIKDKAIYKNGDKRETEICLVASYSEVYRSLMITKPDSYKKLLKGIEPKEGETVCILHPGLVFSGASSEGKSVVIQDKPLIIKKEVKIPFTGEIGSIGKYETYIVSDKQYNQLKRGGKELTMQGINYTNAENSIELTNKIAGVIKDPGDNLGSFAGEYQYKYYLIGAFYFMGLVMAIVFVISIFSTVYFKILSDVILDREQYKILKKIGMTEAEISKSIHTQVGISFLLPVLLGILHGTMAVKAMESFIHCKFTGSIITGAIALLLIMTVFYLLMSKAYKDMVLRGWDDNETA